MTNTPYTKHGQKQTAKHTHKTTNVNNEHNTHKLTTYEQTKTNTTNTKLKPKT